MPKISVQQSGGNFLHVEISEDMAKFLAGKARIIYECEDHGFHLDPQHHWDLRSVEALLSAVASHRMAQESTKTRK